MTVTIFQSSLHAMILQDYDYIIIAPYNRPNEVYATSQINRIYVIFVKSNDVTSEKRKELTNKVSLLK